MLDTDFLRKYGPMAVVTGASSGIGKAFAERLAAEGFDVVLVARRVERLAHLAARLTTDHGVRASICQADLTRGDAAEHILDATRALDIGLVVSNAGFGLKGEHAGNDANAMTGMLMVNCNTPLLLAHGFIPRLRQRGRGGFIFTASVEGLIGCPYSTAYSASKALVVAMGEGLWGELAPEGLSVLTICPGATNTEAAALQGVDLSKIQNVMEPEEVVDMALENIENGPTLVTSPHYRAMFDHLRAMPRREALTAMAKSLKACPHAST